MSVTDSRPLGAKNNEIVQSVGISPRTVTRWRKDPPQPIKGLLKTAAGRDLLRSWIVQAEGEGQQETQRAA